MRRAMNLVLPKQYVEIEQDEMMYLEGGDWSRLRNNIIGLAAFTGAIGYLSKKILNAIGYSETIGTIIAKAGALILQIRSYFGGWVGWAVFGATVGVAVTGLWNWRLFY